MDILDVVPGSLVGFVLKGGVLVIPILICSVLALGIFIERLIYYTRIRHCGSGFVQGIVGLLDKGHFDEAKQTVQNSQSPMGRVIGQAIDAKDCDRETLETVMDGLPYAPGQYRGIDFSAHVLDHHKGLDHPDNRPEQTQQRGDIPHCGKHLKA